MSCWFPLITDDSNPLAGSKIMGGWPKWNNPLSIQPRSQGLNDWFDWLHHIASIYIYIWVNYNNSLTWIKAIKGDDFPNINHDSSEGEQWGRYNLPRYMSCISKVIDKSWVGDDTISPKTHDMPSCSISLVCFHFGWTPKFICWLNPDSCWLNPDSGMVNRRNSSKWLTLMNAYSWYSWYNCP